MQNGAMLAARGLVIFPFLNSRKNLTKRETHWNIHSTVADMYMYICIAGQRALHGTTVEDHGCPIQLRVCGCETATGSIIVGVDCKKTQHTEVQ